MQIQENTLREKLDLSTKDILLLREFNRKTRNINYILEVNNVPSYFIKVNSEGRRKEREMFSFLEQHQLFNTISPVHIDKDILIFPFIKGLRDADVKDNLPFIVDFHNRALQLPQSTFKDYKDNYLFENHYVKKFIERIQRHEELVLNFWKDIPSLRKFCQENPPKIFEDIPKILVHGDIQHKNLQQDLDGSVYLIDFEDIYFDYPSWDLSRPLMDLDSSEIDNYIQRYSSKVNLQDKSLLLRIINRDFVIRVITDSIGRQQREGVDNAKIYLDIYHERYTKRLEEIIYGNI